MLERIGAAIDPETEVRRLSMPEQQLVEIARALGAEARILIMDEPTASLSDKEVDRLFRVIGDLKSQRGRHHLHLPSPRRAATESPIA